MTTYWVAISRQERGFNITIHHTGSVENVAFSTLERASLEQSGPSLLILFSFVINASPGL